jgi:hypothetical protein
MNTNGFSKLRGIFLKNHSSFAAKMHKRRKNGDSDCDLQLKFPFTRQMQHYFGNQS